LTDRGATPDLPPMTASALETAISAQYEALTKGQRRIADYVLGHREEVAFMSAREFAAAVQTSDAAVVRFAQAIGFEGLGALRAMLRHELLRERGRIHDTRASTGITLDHALIERVREFDQELIASTIRSNDWRVFAAMAQEIVNARTIHVVGHGTTFPMACYLAMLLNELLGNAGTLTAGAGDINHRLLSVGPDTVVIAVAFPRYNRFTVEAAQIARDRGARVLALTDGPQSILAPHADHFVSIAYGGAGSIMSHAGTMAAANLLVSAVEILAGDRVTSNLVAADAILDRIRMRY